MKSDEWIHSLDRRVGSIRNDRSRLQQRPPRVRALHAFRAQAALDPSHVTRLMTRLHRRNDAKLGEPRNVRRTECLRVLDAKAMVGARIFLQRRVERVENDAVSAISDGVHVDLESIPQSQFRSATKV